MRVFERILVATDYSDCSRAALEQAAYIARSTGADLHVAHVIDSLDENRFIDAYESVLDRHAFQEALMSTSRSLMREFLEASGVADSEVATTHIFGGRKADAVLEYATNESVSLIVVGTHGRRGIRRLLLGSVARAIVTASAIPTLAARAPTAGHADKPVRRILAPVDLSTNSLKGLEAAQSLASLFHAQVEIVHVLEKYVFPVSLSEIKTARDLVPDIESRVRRMLKAHVESLSGPYIPYSLHVREGDPATTIVDLAAELACDLIVVTRRGLSASARYVVGSVTEKVLQSAACSVFVQPAGPGHE